METTLTTRLEDSTGQICLICGAMLMIVVNGRRPEVELVCDCGVDRALS